MSLIAIIGDLHGCINTLKSLYPKLKEKTDEIYSVGDLVDRGPDSKAVIQFCMDNNIKCVRGNHEDILLKVIGEEPDRPDITPQKRLENHIINGGDATYMSYTGSRDIDRELYKQNLIDTGHLDFIKSFPFKIEFPWVILTHAGITSATDDVIWHREVPAKLDKFQVFGHTPVHKIDHKPHWYANIDTGCIYKERGFGILTAILLDSETGEVIEVIQEENKTDERIL